METGKLFNLALDIDYSKDAVVSKTIIKKTTGTVTLFAFDSGQGLSPHVAPFDALVQILDGECSFSIEDTKYLMGKGDCIILPAGKTHAVEALKPFKMLLTMIKISDISMRRAD
ncbi:MAG: cupin domain-containing protein [Bacteroidetes bacterium]|nr:cupin domain-containing protein [Bacteroidota bacterium]MCL6102805.1 cupin domain-containing protein [Bacteroidota bacterium]